MDPGIPLTDVTNAGLVRVQSKLPHLVLDAAAHGLMKRELRASTHNISSSNLAEALARGLGFRTSGAIRSAIAKSDEVQIDWTAFRDFFVGKECAVSPEAFLLSVAKSAMVQAIALEPELTSGGIGPHQTSLTSVCYEDAVAHEQEWLLNSVSLVMFLASLAAIQDLEQQEDINPTATAPRLTRLICRTSRSREIGRLNLVFRPRDGCSIAAALYAGFQMMKIPLGASRFGLGKTQGAAFNISEASLLALET